MRNVGRQSEPESMANMLRTISRLLAPEKDGKQMAESAAEEASTAPGSDCTRDGADASLPTDSAFDMSIE